MTRQHTDVDDPLPDRWRDLLAIRATRPDAVPEAYARRRRPDRLLGERGTLFLVAADHPARGALGVREPLAMLRLDAAAQTLRCAHGDPVRAA